MRGLTKKGVRCGKCLCDCGNLTTVTTKTLRCGVKPSCGCAAVEAVIKSNKTRTGQKCMHPIRRSLSERCWEKLNKNGPMPTTCSPEFGVCWLWTAADWGRVWNAWYRRPQDAKTCNTCIVVLEHGVWPTLNMCHACDTPACIRIRPSHLFEGTDADNQYDALERTRRDNYCSSIGSPNAKRKEFFAWKKKQA